MSRPAIQKEHSDLNETQFQKIAEELNTYGLVVISDFFSPSDLERARIEVQEKISEFNNRSVSLVGNPRIVGSEFDRHSQRIETLFRNIGLFEPACQNVNDDLLEVVRIIAGDQVSASQNHAYHFDSHVLTALFPIMIPNDLVDNGDLVLWPNIRSAHGGFIINALQKAVAQNPFARWIFSKESIRNAVGARSIALKPGNLYIFWGYRSYHGNLPISKDKVRATALYHMFYRHHSNPVLKFARSRRKRIDDRRRDAAKLRAKP